MRRVLLIEDEPIVRKLLGNLLESIGFEVESTSSIAGAKTLVESSSFDLIVSDYTLEDGKADVLYSWIGLEHPELVNRFILVTGWPDLEGFPVILQKPFRLKELEEVVKQVLGD